MNTVSFTGHPSAAVFSIYDLHKLLQRQLSTKQTRLWNGKFVFTYFKNKNCRNAIYDTITGKIHKLEQKSRAPCVELVTLRSGSFAIIDVHKIHVYNQYSYQKIHTLEYLDDDVVECLCELRDGRLLIGGSHFLAVYDATFSMVKQYYVDSAPVSSIIQLSDDSIALGGWYVNLFIMNLDLDIINEIEVKDVLSITEIQPWTLLVVDISHIRIVDVKNGNVLHTFIVCFL
jgi:hypothetical protein